MPEWDKLEINTWEETLKHAKVLALDLDFRGEDPENPVGGFFATWEGCLRISIKWGVYYSLD